MSKISAGLVAADLRKLADALDAEPDAKIIKPWVWFYGDDKGSFLATARILPRPLDKEVENPGTTYAKLKVSCTALTAIDVYATVPQSTTCELIEPAKPAVYRCDPILSAVEEEMVAQ